MTVRKGSELEQVLAEINEKLSKVVSEQEKIKHVLVGDEYTKNGIIQRVTTLEDAKCVECQKPRVDEMSKRLTDIERKMYIASGVIITVSTAAAYLIKIIF